MGDDRQAAVVVNPTKVDDLDTLRSHLTEVMRSAGWAEPTWLETTADDPGYGMAREALDAGVDLVIACGGDGTVRAVLTELAGSDVALGVLPAGTGNLLARNLDIPVDDMDAALDIALSGADRRVDVAIVAPPTQANRENADRAERFAIMAGLGFDAAMMRDAPEKLKARMGWPAYIVSAAKHLRGEGFSATITVDDAPPVRMRASTVLVGNMGQLPAGLDLFPDADPDDGILDVAVIASRGLVDWARIATRVVTNRNDVDHRYQVFTGRKVVVVADRAQARQLDGDPIDRSAGLTVTVEPHALLVRVPRADGDDRRDEQRAAVPVVG